MGSKARIQVLSATIAAGTDTIHEYHSSQGLPPLSFDPNPALFDIAYPPEVARARQALLEAVDELQALIAGPLDAWVRPVVITRYKLANSFPKDKDEATYEELAAASGLGVSNVQRVVRASAASYIFREPTKGVVAHTAASKLFSVNEHLQQWVGMVTDDLWPASTSFADALEKYPLSDEPNEAAYNLANATDKYIFQYLSDKPGRAKRFADAMSWFNAGAGYEPEHLLNNYPWAELGTATMVDVGGSHGPAAIEVARRFPAMTVIVQDLPEVVSTAVVPADLEGRVSFQPYDFFTEQPIQDAQVYFYRWILHDWSDKYAAQILRGLVPAMKPGTRLLINDYLMPDPGVIPRTMERDIRAFDLVMWQMSNGKERSKDDITALLKAADPRFYLNRVITPPGSKLAILEVTWTG